jgi:hypothetical protein
VAFPNKGFNCNQDIHYGALIQADPAAGLEHCPDRPERQTLSNGVTRAVAYPK